MKKLLLTACILAFITLTGTAQDTTRTESNQYRQDQQRTDQEMDNEANDNRVENTMNQDQDTEVEVLESKEGPNNEVVYRIQGELYYVDRDEKKLVKTDESELKDTENKAIVKDNDQ